jgi:hypothetical protein
MKQTQMEITTGNFGNGNTDENPKALITGRKKIFQFNPRRSYYVHILLLRSLTSKVVDTTIFSLSRYAKFRLF